jgi:hypothetical protein
VHRRSTLHFLAVIGDLSDDSGLYGNVLAMVETVPKLQTSAPWSGLKSPALQGVVQRYGRSAHEALTWEELSGRRRFVIRSRASAELCQPASIRRAVAYRVRLVPDMATRITPLRKKSH